MASRYDKMYGNSPRLEKGEDGKPKIVKPTKAQVDSARVSDGTAGMPLDDSKGIPSTLRHAIERKQMVDRHETEHMVLDHTGAAKDDVYKRHMKERQDMEKRHKKEFPSTGGEQISKIEKGE